MKFTISLSEINRRKKAFTTLIISILAGLILSSLDFIIKNFTLSGFIILIVASLLSLSKFWTVKFLNTFTKTRYQIKKDYLERISQNSKEKCLFKNIKQINIKKTTNDTIRDIRLFLQGQKGIFINGLADFKNFEKQLLAQCPKAKIKRIKEPLDFDHPLFYVFFGLFVSSVFTSFIRLIYSQNQTNLKITFVILLLYNTGVSIFFIISKPFSKTFGQTKIFLDYLIGAVLTIITFSLGIYIYIM